MGFLAHQYIWLQLGIPLRDIRETVRSAGVNGGSRQRLDKKFERRCKMKPERANEYIGDFDINPDDLQAFGKPSGWRRKS
jgi:hypothetical protein